MREKFGETRCPQSLRAQLSIRDIMAIAEMRAARLVELWVSRVGLALAHVCSYASASHWKLHSWLSQSPAREVVFLL